MSRFRKERTISYVDSHNTAVLRYRRYCKAFIWVGVVNFVGLIIGIIQFYIQKNVEVVPFYFCFGVCDILFSLLYPLTLQGLHIAWFWVIAISFSLITTSLAVLGGLFSSYGKKKYLFSILIFYFVDWVLVILNYFFVARYLTGLLINAGIHAISTFFIVMAVYQYYNVINIEKRFKDVPTVEQQKAVEEVEGEKTEDGN